MSTNIKDELALLFLKHQELEISNQWLPILEAYISSKVNEGKIAILKEIQPPKAEMIPNWEWPCHICGFDSEKFREWTVDRIRTLKKMNTPKGEIE